MTPICCNNSGVVADFPHSAQLLNKTLNEMKWNDSKSIYFIASCSILMRNLFHFLMLFCFRLLMNYAFAKKMKKKKICRFQKINVGIQYVSCIKYYYDCMYFMPLLCDSFDSAELTISLPLNKKILIEFVLFRDFNNRRKKTKSIFKRGKR